MAGFRLFKRHLICQTKQPGLTHTQWAVLSTIRDNEGICIGKIAEILSMSSSAATQLVNELAGKGFVQRKPQSKDKRVLEISLTEEAHTKFAHMSQERAERLALLFETLDDVEFAQYVQLTKKIFSHI